MWLVQVDSKRISKTFCSNSIVTRMTSRFFDRIKLCANLHPCIHYLGARATNGSEILSLPVYVQIRKWWRNWILKMLYRAKAIMERSISFSLKKGIVLTTEKGIVLTTELSSPLPRFSPPLHLPLCPPALPLPCCPSPSCYDIFVPYPARQILSPSF